MAKNQIGLDAAKAQDLSQKLNTLLANYQVFYMNTRGYHWNVKGEYFFELHLKFEEIYNDLLIKVDEIAERILTLGHLPEHSYSSYLKNSALKEDVNQTDGVACLKGVVLGFQTVLELQREIMDKANEAEDEGTATLMSDYISEQEKTIWMLNARLA